ncbi:OLC1v1004808C1 [Oldenlandia corymbosa var. corymbosa]|uniref:OLC1v1004808C1 n=1 Tax=Oldenlandia corymbosa var. corymbosa TaxID=529605 RepID=A0AAV1DFK9_OLDCO|nr:OLC1v1004808C1 [Oldenlandia corymbosa var. corymbosa]
MSTCVMMMSKSNHLQFASSSSSPSPIKLEEESSSQKQGIVSILGSDSESSKSSAASLRRTLSADMSSKKWLAQNGFNSSNNNNNKVSPMKRIASSEELLAVNSSSSGLILMEDDQDHQFKGHPGQDEVWRSIQAQKKADADDKWTWGSILFEKRNEQNSSKLPPPYIPPLMRRSTSGLSEKSLEICTESLGSETGSDGFSSYPPSEVGDVEDEKEHQEQIHHHQQQQFPADWYDDLQVAKYSYSNSKKVASGPRSFPPPLPSLARDSGASVHMQSHRQNGRLVLEAVSVPSQNYFQAHREHGRLRLSFVDDPPTSEDDDEVDECDEQVFDNYEEINGENDRDASSWPRDQDETEEEEEEYPDQRGENPSSKLNVFKPTSTILVKKIMGLEKKNLSWSSRFNRGANLLEVDQEIMVVEGDDNEPIHPPPLPQSLPPAPPRVVARVISNTPSGTSAAAASFNAYEYFWRESKPTMATIIKPVSINANTNQQEKQQNHCSAELKNNQTKQVNLSNSLNAYEQQQNLVVMRGGNKADYLAPFLKRSCNESRRSLLLWEPYCIAT